jgi:cell division protein FtsW (lipid II flippase)
LLPITGIVLPFVSYGATAMVVSLAAVGVMINIAQHGTAHGAP